ncbi:hypothetical protein Tco_1231704 [Tanacetum coccineum]
MLYSSVKLVLTPVADEAASTGVDVRYGGATTTVTGLEAGQGSGNIDKTPTMHQDSPLLRVNTLGSDEGSMTQHELIAFCTTLSKKVESLETDLKQTKLIYGAAYTRLIKKVKKLEKIVKSSQARRARIIRRYGHDMEFDFNFDAAKEVSTIEKDVSTDVLVSTAGVAVTTASVVVSTVSPTRNTIVSTADDITMAKIMVYIKKSAVKDKAVRLQAKLKEERRQRIARVHEPASSFNVEEWEDIQFIVEVDEEAYQPEKEIKTLFETTMRKVDTFVLIESEVDRAVPKLAARSTKRAVEEELDQESSKRQKTVPEQGMNVKALQTKYPIIDWEIYTKGTRKYWKIIRVGNHTKSLVKEKFNSTEPTYDKEKDIWVEVHHVYTEDGIDIYMLVEKEYQLSRGTLTLMLVAKLLVDQDNEMSRELLRKIFMQVERLRR